MPVLLIRYGDLVLHDGDVDELTFTDAPGEVSVTGRLATPKPAGGGAGLLDLLAGARKAQTQRMVEEKRQENLEEDSAATDPEAENA